MEWADYYDRFYDWAESTQINRISGLTGFDSSAEVAEIVCNIYDSNAASRLVRKAMSENVTFTADEIMEMLDFLNDDTIEEIVKTSRDKFTAEQLEALSDYCLDDSVISSIAKRSGVRMTYGDFEEAPLEEAPQKKLGFWGGLALLGSLFGGSKTHQAGHYCDGDCNKCPAHYGYRYGRWYYGHGHQHGCERHGNGGASGKCHREP